MKLIKYVLKIISIAFILFVLKHFIQAIIEYTDILPVRPKAYIWGMHARAKYIVGWQFIYTFWIYILTVIGIYFILKTKFLKNLKSWKIISILSLLIFLFLLKINRFEFPIKKTYLPHGEQINYGLIEDFIIYSTVGTMLIFLIRKWLINKKR
ncbi:MAG: hypothetical protein U1C58_00760 [Flavobacteriaceae bacterium]|nr:hypothetical protein [Flavobacteriaceae bacterium]